MSPLPDASSIRLTKRTLAVKAQLSAVEGNGNRFDTEMGGSLASADLPLDRSPDGSYSLRNHPAGNRLRRPGDVRRAIQVGLFHEHQDAARPLLRHPQSAGPGDRPVGRDAMSYQRDERDGAGVAQDLRTREPGAGRSDRDERPLPGRDAPQRHCGDRADLSPRPDRRLMPPISPIMSTWAARTPEASPPPAKYTRAGGACGWAHPNSDSTGASRHHYRPTARPTRRSGPGTPR